MSIANIEDLRTKLENRHWVIREEHFVDEYDVCGYWLIARPDDTNRLTIKFGGGYDAGGVRKLPFEECYGCSVAEHPEAELYFGRIGRSWPAELEKFLLKLNELG